MVYRVVEAEQGAHGLSNMAVRAERVKDKREVDEACSALCDGGGDDGVDLVLVGEGASRNTRPMGPAASIRSGGVS